MAKKDWIFLSNTFEVQTRGSFRKMLTLATDTDSKLHSAIDDPVIAGIYAVYHPVFQDYLPLYANYNMAEGNYTGKTLQLELLLEKTLLDKLRRWESAVRNVHPEDSPEETAIFPRKRTPFLRGTYEKRISAIGTLAEKLGSDPLLAAVAGQVQAFYSEVLGARDQQQQQEGEVKAAAQLLENQRLLVAEALWGIVLARLMERYRSAPLSIAAFFDTGLLRRKRKRKGEKPPAP